MYEDKTEYVINQDMLAKVTSPVSKQEGTFVWDSLSPVANELAKIYIELDSILKKGFVSTSYGSWLDMKAEEFGIFRKTGTKATSTVTFTGTDGALIQAGSLVQTVEGLRYKTLTDGVVTNGSISISVEALEIGSKYNVASTLICGAPISLIGIATISNNVPAIGGTDIETDEALAARLLLKARTPAVSGNVNHYKQWALEVEGVGDARIYPIWNGGGTVKVCLIDSNMLPVSDVILNNVSTHIQEEKPIGSVVTCVAATPLYINVGVNVSLDGSLSLDAVKTLITANLNSYFKSIAFRLDFVSYAKITSIILTTSGVADCTNLTINNTDKNITIDAERVALLGTISVA